MFKSAITKRVLNAYVFFHRFWSQTFCLPALRLLFTYQKCTFLGGNKALQGSIWKHSISPAVSSGATVGKGSQGWGGTPVQRVQFSWVSFRAFLNSVFPYSPCAYRILNIFKWCSGLRKFCIPVEVKSIRLWWTGKALLNAVSGITSLRHNRNTSQLIWTFHIWPFKNRLRLRLQGRMNCLINLAIFLFESKSCFGLSVVCLYSVVFL